MNKPTHAAKHAPGPWTVQTLMKKWHGFPDWTTYCIRSQGNIHLATVGDMDRFYEKETGANAYLMATAPDLLKLAEHVLAMADDAYLVGHPEWLEIVKEATAAKAKTEGRA